MAFAIVSLRLVAVAIAALPCEVGIKQTHSREPTAPADSRSLARKRWHPPPPLSPGPLLVRFRLPRRHPRQGASDKQEWRLACAAQPLRLWADSPRRRP